MHPLPMRWSTTGREQPFFCSVMPNKCTLIMADLILSKESSESEIKRYFNAVLELSESDNEFPVNLDEVWMLVYGRKSDATEALQRDFIENVDYRVLRQNPQNPNGGRPTNEYRITVSCMEFFIARKVRSVFEVYRKVFHKTVNKAIEDKPSSKREPTISDKIKVATWLIKTLNLNDTSKLMLAKSIADPLGLPTPDYTPSHGILKSASELLKERNVSISAQVFNKRAIEKGYLCEQERNSSHGQKKRFKSITNKGLSYGENQVNPNNPKSTQPLWYEDKFMELLGVLGFQLTGGLAYAN